MKNNPFVRKIIQLNDEIADRKEFHKQSANLLPQMAKDPNFWSEVFKQNLTDKGFLSRKWSMYEIPFFYVYECDDFYLKIHLFVPLKSKAANVAASAIHHHNNYLLTSHAAFGSGYESMLFEKNVEIDSQSKETKLKIRRRFHQKDEPVHLVDSWEPHVVINPSSLSATLVLWSPDKKRKTDTLRSNPILKAIKIPLRKVIYTLGLDKKIGIAAQRTYQFYTQNNKFYAVLEDDFFAPTRAQTGPEVDDYSVQTLFAFMQRMGFRDLSFFSKIKLSVDTPKYYHKWIDSIVNEEEIEDTYAKEVINIPDGIMTIENILEANNNVNHL